MNIPPSTTGSAEQRLLGRVALITGASRGIGAAIAIELSRNGAYSYVNYCEDADGARSVVDEIRSNGNEAESVQFDVSRLDEVKRSVAAIRSRHGRIDVLINNAGILRDRTFSKMTEQEWMDVLSVNLLGVINATSAVVPSMIDNNWGRIVNVSSFVAQSGNFGQTNYAASKAGIIGFSRSLALEVGRSGISVNCVCPGFIDTGMWGGIPEDVQKKILERIPLKRVGRPSEVASAVRYLVTEGDYITGQTMNVNGGVFIG